MLSKLHLTLDGEHFLDLTRKKNRKRGCIAAWRDDKTSSSTLLKLQSDNWDLNTKKRTGKQSWARDNTAATM